MFCFVIYNVNIDIKNKKDKKKMETLLNLYNIIKVIKALEKHLCSAVWNYHVTWIMYYLLYIM